MIKTTLFQRLEIYNLGCDKPFCTLLLEDIEEFDNSCENILKIKLLNGSDFKISYGFFHIKTFEYDFETKEELLINDDYFYD